MQQILKFNNLGFSEEKKLLWKLASYEKLMNGEVVKIGNTPEIYFGSLMPRAVRQFTKNSVSLHNLESTIVRVYLQYL